MARRPPVSRLGACRLRSRIGEGSTGTVYEASLAVDTPYGSVGDRVAVKVLHGHFVHDSEAFHRLRQEAEIAAAVDHDAILKVHELGMELLPLEGDNRQPTYFLVEELGEGCTLRALLHSQGRLPEPMVRELARRIAQGLGAMHEAGALHRDLKPENLLVTTGYGVKIMDLGIAVPHEEAARPAEGAFYGSPYYAAPEQFEGGAIGPAADLYALGAVLYELAAGQAPFVESSFAALRRRHLEDDPVPLRKINPAVSSSLEELVLGLLAKRPELRPPSAAALVRELEAAERTGITEDSWVASLRKGAPTPGDGAFVGRDAELQRLVHRIRGLQEGEGGVLLVEGEAGIGKSRLLRECLAGVSSLSSEVHLLWSQGAPGPAGSGPSPVVTALADLLGRGDTVRRIRALLPDSAQLVEPLAHHLLGDESRPEAARLSSRERPVALSRLLLGLTAELPALWVVEDLHFWSEEDLELLADLADRAAGSPVLFLGTARIDGPWPEAWRELIESDGVERMRLRGLAPPDQQRLLRSMGPGKTDDQEAIHRAAERCGGNPLFLLSIWHSRQAPRPSAGHVGETRSGASPDDEIIPASVQDLVEARLQQLEGEDRLLLEAAAVQGFQLEPELLAFTLDWPLLRVLQGLGRLEAERGMVRTSGGTFQFEHHLLLEVLYDLLDEEARRELHERTGRSLHEALSGEDGGSLEEKWRALSHLLSGECWNLANELLGVITARDPCLGDGGGIHRIALQALDVEGRLDPGLLCVVASALATRLLWKGDAEAALQTADKAVRLGRASTDPGTLGKARRARGRIWFDTRRVGEAREELLEALGLVRQAGDREAEGRVFVDLASVSTFLSRPEEAQERLDLGLQRFREAGCTYSEIRATPLLAILAGQRGTEAEVIPVLEEALDKARALGLREETAHILMYLARFAKYRGDFDEARRICTECLAVARGSGNVALEWATVQDLGLLDRWQGDLPSARTRFEATYAHYTATGLQRMQASVLGALGRLRLMEGALREAEDLARMGLQGCLASSSGADESLHRSLLGEVLYARGATQEALSELGRALLLAEERATESQWAIVACILGEVLIDLGEEDRAREHLETALRLSRDRFFPEIGSLPQALLALLGHHDPTSVEASRKSTVEVRIRTHLALGQAGGGVQHLDDARSLLQRVSSHLRGTEREHFWRSYPPARTLREETGIAD